jgi:NADPH:quinone reductase-like Zn-dependent oxidoreductase
MASLPAEASSQESTMSIPVDYSDTQDRHEDAGDIVGLSPSSQSLTGEARTPAHMKAMRIDAFGGEEVFGERTIPVPVPGDDELLVKVAAAGVNPVDYKIRAGAYPPVKSSMLPYTLGRDVSGTVIRCGAAIERFVEGDTLIAMPGIERGAYAQYVLVKESEATFKPNSLDLPTAGAIPLAALTAWQGLFRHGRVRKGQRVLIHGGSGGVGHFAVQFAKAREAYVMTTVSTERVDFARHLGADLVIDYKTQRFEDEVGEVDLVFDLIGGETQERSWDVLRPGGTLVSTLTEPSQQKATQKGKGTRALRYTAQESGADLSEIARLIDADKVKPSIARKFPLTAAAAALRYLEHEHPAGKVILIVG